MMMPSIFRGSLFDDFMSNPFDSMFSTDRDLIFGNRNSNLLKTDVKEKDGNYEFDIDLPGYQKEDVSAKLEDGYLTISASRNVNNDEKDDDGNYIRRERYTGHCQRSFFVGKGVKQEDVKAKFENGILHLTVPKIEEQKLVESEKRIEIEG